MTRGERSRPAPKQGKASFGSGRAARGRARAARAAAGRAKKKAVRPAGSVVARPAPVSAGPGRAPGRGAPGRTTPGRPAPGSAGAGRKATGRTVTGRAGQGRAGPGRGRDPAPVVQEPAFNDGSFNDGGSNDAGLGEAGFSEAGFDESSFPEEPQRPSPPKSGSRQRVQKVLARAGIASRRQAEVLIAEGRVRIDGKRVNTQGVVVDPRRAAVSLDGRRISAEPLMYLLLHKPREVMCTMKDPLGRRTVVDYLRGVKFRVVPVGRLDYQTSGVLLLTNDGDFARELLHPSHGVQKEYVLKLKGSVDGAGIQRLRERIDVAGKQTKPARVERLRADDNNTWLVLTLQEGKNRQVRRLAEYAGYRVMRLTRTRFAGLTAEGLRPGQWRELSASEVRSVRGQASPEPPQAAAGQRPRKRR
jgi:23S rRNA pseudouridine2605 synthase